MVSATAYTCGSSHHITLSSYHYLSEILSTLGVTPFQYYRQLLTEHLLEEKDFGIIPSFTVG